jgi:hypothetical protein
MYGDLLGDASDAMEGEMQVPNQTSSSPQDGNLEFNTLDEPIKTTVVFTNL